jgi:hypothetical protein
MQSLTGRGPDAWCDVEFGFRAYKKGYDFRRVSSALGYHDDVAAKSLEAKCARWERASRSAALLFQLHPDLLPHLPMFRDKTPIAFSRDSPGLIVRKMGRRLTAWRPMLRGMEGLVRMVERTAPLPALLRPLCRWTVSSYIYRGYRQGLREERRLRGEV